uniref:G-type lectin S-receptor-like serine/threonine-protein kinase CES101 n=1 Tax=Erigeron canadensis TaxID=72917 RepID=UPI001CB9721F|nr:G-type lectin S-receptor-like serine/threonine-protein kinase CES101 [Erigeron canadensis]
MHQDGQLKGEILDFDVRCGSINDRGCAEYEFQHLNCRKGYYFRKLYGYHLENEYVYDESYNLTLYDCKRICWSNCSCVAYTYATQNLIGCKTYSKMRYNPSESYRDTGCFGFTKDFIEKEKKKWAWLIIGFGSLAPLISLYFVEKKFQIKDKGKIIQKLLLHKLRRLYDYIQADRNMNNELHYFTFQSISSATNNFSSTNKLGEGGFGTVYKGILVDGQEVAVKRLSRSSEQGVTEFKNETELIAKLQHTNLVRLIGCCVEKKEKILVYEYMPNNSLDFFLFDSEKKGLLDWRDRFAIINGIAQGLLYLHKFSRLRIIHRDLKASNILLDEHLNPKISDFGMAKLFSTNESETNTTRVVGTRGYMPPEYMIDGNVSTKTDVFSFGVLLIEIVSSKMNHGSYDPDHPLNLLGLAWELWNESRGLELMDQVLEDSCTHKEVMTCIHVGLLCVQHHTMDRPAMSDVIYMLTNEYMELPAPKRPAFYIERHEAKETGDDRSGNRSVNGQSVSIELGRLKTMAGGEIFRFSVLTLIFFIFFAFCYSKTDTLRQGQELKDWDELTSSNKVFSLKLFSFDTMDSAYLGIFYNKNDNNKIRNHYSYDFRNKAVWVANRNNPVPDICGRLLIDIYGKLSIISSGRSVLDLFSPSLIIRNVSAKLLDTGNLVLHELYPDGSVMRVLWQSFDYPTDTLLPGMKLGINLKTGHRWSLTSWVSYRLPASGSFTLTGDENGTDQLVILRGRNVHWMSGPWQNGRFRNTILESSVSVSDVHLYYVSNENEQSFTFLTKTYDVFPALRITESGGFAGSSSRPESGILCNCNFGPGFVKSRLENLKCRENANFYSGEDYHYPHSSGFIYTDEYEYDERHNLTLYDCKRLCWTNCTCIAYSYATKNREGCKIYRQMIYNPVEVDKVAQYYIFQGREKKKKKWIWLIIGVGSLAPLLSCYLFYKKFHLRGKTKKIRNLFMYLLRRWFRSDKKHRNINIELHYFTFQSIMSATNNFSGTNKLGEGGFGTVYKGKLGDGQEVAVKRLSKSSGQGVTEFKNETELIAKLQHTNLVRLLGCCTEKQENILVYEYMPNNSLDFYIFDPRKKGLLDWNTRFVIIDGIAQGLVYLHKFSRLRVIHRDLKASNILLDGYLNPKISDFGMAKLIGSNQSQANTSRVVGTRGYMPPEYMMEGTVSTKTDVFSFGVLLLEIVSGKMNHGSYDLEHPLNLPGYAWELWNEGRGLELMDPILEDSCSHVEVMTCIHVGLLCVQDHDTDRPTMSEVISMLTNEKMDLLEPKRPAFYIDRHELEATTDNNLENQSINGQSISILVAR